MKKARRFTACRTFRAALATTFPLVETGLLAARLNLDIDLKLTATETISPAQVWSCGSSAR